MTRWAHSCMPKLLCIYLVYMYIHSKLHVHVTVFYIQLHGRTALHLAAEEGRVDVVRLLIEAKAQVNIQTKVILVY